jgi:ribosomal protein S12 methylthiotransferase accessory factor
LEEAVCHALCEVIERDAVSLADLRASAIPYHILRSIASLSHSAGIKLTVASGKFVDDPSIFPDVDVSDLDFRPAKRLINRFKNVGIPLIIKNITSDIGIPTFNAASIEWISHDYGYLAEGHGTHPDKRIALLRAITEVSQTRAANIQGARDDLRKIKYSDTNTDDKRAWQFMPSSKVEKFSDIPTTFNEDILEDIKLILSKFQQAALNHAIIVDLTNPDIGIPVVRAIVPGLETFRITKKVMGKRARSYFRQWSGPQ